MSSANSFYLKDLSVKCVHNIIYVNKEKRRAQHTLLRYTIGHISIVG